MAQNRMMRTAMGATRQKPSSTINGDDIIQDMDSLKRDTHDFERGLMTEPQFRRNVRQLLAKRVGPLKAGSDGKMKALTIDYKFGDGSGLQMEWDYVPRFESPTGNTLVLAFCPACFMRGPAVDLQTRSAPAVRENTLGKILGNPEADAKVVVFPLDAPAYHITVDEREKLTVRELVRCPRSGVCTWTARVENGVARREVSGIVRGGARKGGPITGPLIIVK